MIWLRYIHYFEQEGLLLAEFVSDFSFFFNGYMMDIMAEERKIY